MRSLPHDHYGRLVGEFQFSSHVPLRGGQDTGRHIYLSIKVPEGPNGGIYECAVNIRSDEGTEVQYAERIEDLDSGGLPALRIPGRAAPCLWVRHRPTWLKTTWA